MRREGRAIRVLQIGAGSMGTRRLRDLSGLDGIEVHLFDPRVDRRERAHQQFGVPSSDNLDDALARRPDAVVISTPPDQHSEYVRLAVDLGAHVFCEADIWPVDPVVAERAARSGLMLAPSATLLFHPLIREVRRIAKEELGTMHAFGYVLSVDASSWHPGEGDEYYARHRPTAPAREMTAFELIGLQGIVGHATSVSAVVHRRGQPEIPGEDSYTLQYRTEAGAAGQLSVLMASPQVVRRGWLAGDHGFVAFDLLSGVVERRLPAVHIEDERKICDWALTLESVYLQEISTFIRAIQGLAEWPYRPVDSGKVGATLAAAELSALSGRAELTRAGLVPAAVPDAYPLPSAGTR